MRIVGGRWRGRRIQAPEGSSTRPTTDRMREALASMVASECGLRLEGVRILDAFAGSGACSLEFLSRGAESATLVEAHPKARRAIRANLEELGATEVAELVAGDAFRLAREGRLFGAPFSLVLLDPPYATDPVRLQGLLRDLAMADLLGPGALVVHERSAQAKGMAPPALADEGFSLVRSRRLSQSAVDLWRYDGAAGRADDEGRGRPMGRDGIERVVVPGSFDPVTLGHLDVIARARRLCPHVVVAVASSERKRGVGTEFTLQERLALVRESLDDADLDDVELAPLTGLLVDFCHEVGAQAVVKGLRAATDFEYELQQAAVNQILAGDLESIFVMSKPEFGFVSSSVVREISALGGDVSALVPPCVLRRLAR